MVQPSTEVTLTTYMIYIYDCSLSVPGLLLIIHFEIPRLLPDFFLTFYSFPYPLTAQKIIFILYFNGVICITSNLGVALKGKNLLPKGANSFL